MRCHVALSGVVPGVVVGLAWTFSRFLAPDFAFGSMYETTNIVGVKEYDQDRRDNQVEHLWQIDADMGKECWT